MEGHWVDQPDFRAGSMPRSKWPTQNELHFLNVLVHFFVLLVFCFDFLSFFEKERERERVREQERAWSGVGREVERILEGNQYDYSLSYETTFLIKKSWNIPSCQYLLVEEKNVPKCYARKKKRKKERLKWAPAVEQASSFLEWSDMLTDLHGNIHATHRKRQLYVGFTAEQM